MSSTFAYNTADQPLSETWSGGVLNGMVVTNAYDSCLRRAALGLNTQPSILTQFGYDNASSLLAVTNGAVKVAYAYVANSPLVSQITFTNNGVGRMSSTKQYDFLNRLTSISSEPSASCVVSFSYSYNNANQRTRRIDADGSYWRYEYDPLGQVRSGKKYWSDGTSVAGQQFEYGFDDIGNRVATKAGGDQNGANLRGANYGANSLNQYTNRDVPGYTQITGVAFATNAVTVNSLATYRKGEYFWKELAVNNGSAPQWQSVSVAATGETTVNGNVFFAKTQEIFAYDPDGNLTSDGRFSYAWDAENRLTQMESLSTGPTPSKRRVVWEFDSQGRRIRQTRSDGSSGSYVVFEDLKFLSGGWQHIAELNATNNALARSYVWGLDISGTTDAAGGVGGLLILNNVGNGTHFCAFDGNGNTIALVQASEGTPSANYEFDCFGQTIRATGLAAKENPFRFSTKRTDDSSDVVLYELRPFSASGGRFLGRDPAEEGGGRNLYGFVANDAVNWADLLGMVIICCNADEYFQSLGLRKGIDYENPSGQPATYYAATARAHISPDDSLQKQIVLQMLISRLRTFTAKNLDPVQLQKHVDARVSVVSLTAPAVVRWQFGDDPRSRATRGMNPAYWSQAGVLLPGARADAAVADYFSDNAANYVTGCRYGSLFVLLEGIRRVMGSGDFNNISSAPGATIEDQGLNSRVVRVDSRIPERPKGAGIPLDWVPGDRGIIRAKDGGHGIAGGQWLIYVGDNYFWGHGRYNPPQIWQHIRTFSEWFDAEGAGSIDAGKRYYPGVGLQ